MDCYFYLTNILGITLKSKHMVQYPNLPSDTRPVLHSEDCQGHPKSGMYVMKMKVM
jgi:hypothetical protein